MYQGRVSSCSQRLTSALALRRMKQAELCQITKIPKSAISQYISGVFEPKQDRIYIIAKALNVSEAWLMGYDVPMERQEKNKLPPEESALSEGEKMWLDLYNRVSEETRVTLTKMMCSFEKLPADRQRLALDLIRVALGNQK